MTGEHMARAGKGRTLSPATRTILRLLLLTGQRRSEIVGARKSELELNAKEPVWTIPGERTKNGLLHRLSLCSQAKAAFARAVADSPDKSPFVFPSAVEPLKAHISAEAITRAMSRLVSELPLLADQHLSLSDRHRCWVFNAWCAYSRNQHHSAKQSWLWKMR
jgi:integrase